MPPEETVKNIKVEGPKTFFIVKNQLIFVKEMKSIATPYNLPSTMKRLFTLFALLLGLATLAQAGIGDNANLKDSVGLEKVGNNVFILHKVEPKETLYSLSRRYKVEIDEIVKYNPGVESGLKINAVLKIPYQIGQHTAASKTIHTVAPSQTLYSISRIYNVAVGDIKKWNNLNSNELSVGQKLTIYTKTTGKPKEKTVATKPAGEGTSLPTNEERTETGSGKMVHTVEPGQTLYSIAQTYHVEVEDIKKWNSLNGNALDVGQVLAIRVKSEPDSRAGTGKPMEKMDAPAQEKVVRLDHKEETPTEQPEPEAEEKPVRKRENPSGFKKIVELGLAEMIENASDTKKYVALHRTAPIGTIIQVTNEMNNQNVFVRVIGKLPSTGVNEKVLIKLSKPAFERLGAVNDKFPAEISYVP